MELTMDEVIGGCNAVQPLHLRRPRKPGDPGLGHQHGDEPLADFHAHPEGQFGMDAARAVGLP